MNKEIDHLLEYFSLLQIMATAGKTHSAIIHCLGLLAEGAEFRDNYQEQFLHSLKIAMQDSQETLKQLEDAEIRLNKLHSDILSNSTKLPQHH